MQQELSGKSVLRTRWAEAESPSVAHGIVLLVLLVLLKGAVAARQWRTCRGRFYGNVELMARAGHQGAAGHPSAARNRRLAMRVTRLRVPWVRFAYCMQTLEHKLCKRDETVAPWWAWPVDAHPPRRRYLRHSIGGPSDGNSRCNSQRGRLPNCPGRDTRDLVSPAHAALVGRGPHPPTA